MKQLHWITLFGFIPILLFSQSDPSFTSFKGDYYRIPAKKASFEFIYSKSVLEYEKRGSVEYQEINVPDQLNELPFPGTELKQQLAMILHSTMTIIEDACYEFELTSDDGSRLWIDSTLILNNDKSHKMRTKKKSVYLSRGNYNVKLWYTQLFPNRYGFIFNSSCAGPSCADTLLAKKTEPIVLDASVLFDHDSDKLSESGAQLLKEELNTINFEHIKTVSIAGHTDDTGSEDYNIGLSKRRANRVMNFMMSYYPKVGLSYRTIGLGEVMPIASNDDIEGRTRNRRVEIQFTK